MSHVRPVLEYAGTVWCPYLVGDRETLEKVQKRSYKDKLRVLGMTTLQRRRERGDMIQMWRILTGKDRVDPANWFILQGIRPERERHPPGATGGTRLCSQGHQLTWR